MGNVGRKVFDKHAPTLGWIDPGEAITGQRAEVWHALAQGGLLRQVHEVGNLTQTAFVVTTGTLAAPTGVGGVIVDVAATGADVASGRTSLGTGTVVVTAAVAGTFLHLRFANDGIHPTTPAFRNPSEIRFSQDSIRRGFTDPKFGTIDDLAQALRSGRVKPSQIEPIRLVERGGRLVSIDNRRLEAFRRAGMQVPTRMATPDEITEAIRQKKFSAGPAGADTIRIRGD